MNKATPKERFLSIFSHHPLLLITLAAGISGSVILGYKNLWTPYVERKRRISAELYADYLFQQELKNKEKDNDNDLT